MKKLLLSLAVALGFASAQAAPVVVDFGTATGIPTGASAEATAVTVNGVSLSLVNCYSFTNKNVTPNETVLFLKGKDTTPRGNFSFTYTEPVKNITLKTGAGASAKVTVNISANGTVIAENYALNAVATEFTIPVPTANQGAGTVYSVAVSNNYNSQISVLTLNGAGETPAQPSVFEVADIAAFKAASAQTGEIKFTSPVTAVYQNGRYLFVKDATGSLLLYGDLTQKYANGEQVPAGFTGKYQNYQNGLVQMSALVDSTFTAGTAGTPVEPVEVTVEELGLGMVNDYVTLKGVSIAADAAKANTFQLTDATGTINLYNQFNNAQYYDVVTVTEGTNLDVVAFVGCYGGNAQLTAVSVTSATGQEFVATPVFSVAAGEVEAGTEVVIACATEGAAIHYTVDGTEPTAASTLYSAPLVINEACTVKAIAVKEGMADSNVAEAAYTIKTVAPVDPNAKVVTFNFNEPTSINAAWTEANATDDGTTGNKMIALEGNPLFSVAPVSVSMEGTGNPARIYYQPSKNAWTFRFYKSNTLTIALADGCVLKTIEFDTQTTSYATALNGFTFTNGSIAGGVFTANEGVSSTSITVTATCGLNSMKVTYTEGSGIDNVAADNAPVEYFNLQGVRVVNPANGLFIRRQGNNVTKVIL